MSEYQKLHYRSHRGLLELDLLLIPFIESQFAHLSPEQLTNYQDLLKEEDPSLLAYFMGHQEVPSHFQQLVKDILAFKART